MTKDRSRGEREERISRWEWVTGALGLLLVVAALWVLLRDAGEPSSPVRLTVAMDSVTGGPGNYVAHVTVRNAGSLPARSTVIEGVLAPGGEGARSQVTIDLIPSHSRHTAGLVFPRDPRGGALRLRVLGYADP